VTLPIKVDFLPVGHDRPGTPLTPQGVVVHSTATPGATAENEDTAFHTHDFHASAHFFVDWNEAVKLVPLGEVAWHAGPTANSRFIGIELCETADDGQWKQSLANLLELLGMIFPVYGWTVVDDNVLWSHARVSQTFGETDHTDPVEYFASHGYSMDQLKIDLQAQINAGGR